MTSLDNNNWACLVYLSVSEGLESTRASFDRAGDVHDLSLVHCQFVLPKGGFPGKLHVAKVTLDGKRVVVESHVLEQALLPGEFVAADAARVLAAV